MVQPNILHILWFKGNKAYLCLFVDTEGSYNTTNFTTPVYFPLAETAEGAVSHSGLLRASISYW